MGPSVGMGAYAPTCGALSGGERGETQLGGVLGLGRRGTVQPLGLGSGLAGTGESANERAIGGSARGGLARARLSTGAWPPGLDLGWTGV